MYNFKTLTVSEVTEMSNKIALEQGESARAEFITKLLAEYHASLTK